MLLPRPLRVLRGRHARVRVGCVSRSPIYGSDRPGCRAFERPFRFHLPSPKGLITVSTAAADLNNLGPTHGHLEPEREIELHLTGNMNRYMWSIDGIKFADAEPLLWRVGERLRITFVNDTMMNHPMHLHGMWSDLETGDNNYLPRKHTVIVQPGSRISYRVTVDAEGGWAYHCHLLYHMPGMFRTVIVS